MSTDPTYEQRMNDAMLDSFDEELEMEFDDNRMDSLIDELASTGGDETELGRNFYFKELFRCLLYTSPSPRDRTRSRMPSSA